MAKALLVPIVLAAALSGGAAAAESPDDILVVVNRSFPLTETTALEVRNIFLKQKGAWRNGEQAIPFHAKDGSALRQAFRERVLKMTTTEEREHWKNARIKQGQMEPVEFAEVLKAVFKVRGAVSYIFRSDYKEGVVKVVLVVPSR